MLSWWYDCGAEICRNFTYTGYGGNQNNHLTSYECEARCLTRLANSLPRNMSSMSQHQPMAPDHSNQPVLTSYTPERPHPTQEPKTIYVAVPGIVCVESYFY